MGPLTILMMSAFFKTGTKSMAASTCSMIRSRSDSKKASLSHVQLFATPWTVARQAPLWDFPAEIKAGGGYPIGGRYPVAHYFNPVNHYTRAGASCPAASCPGWPD